MRLSPLVAIGGVLVSPTFATTLPPDSSMSREIPSRMSAESSAMTTRSGEASIRR